MNLKLAIQNRINECDRLINDVFVDEENAETHDYYVGYQDALKFCLEIIDLSGKVSCKNTKFKVTEQPTLQAQFGIPHKMFCSKCGLSIESTDLAELYETFSDKHHAIV